MDTLNISHAVALSISHHKKWRQERRRQVKYYGDDNSTCYVYAYTDQLLIDEIQKLNKEAQCRFAPMICGFDPTDMSAVEHVKLVHQKYPTIWAGCGELFFRHDDLTNLAMGRDQEIPRPDHPAMYRIYEYCQENGLIIQAHHNLYKSGSSEMMADWLAQLTNVLQDWPDLTFLLCHCGISRLCWDQDGHHNFVDQILDQFSSLMMDISWVVYECVICDIDGNPKDCWVQLFEKHTTRFTIGSDQVGKFSGSLRLAQKVHKYNKLLALLSDEAAENLGHKNAERIYFHRLKKLQQNESLPNALAHSFY